MRYCKPVEFKHDLPYMKDDLWKLTKVEKHVRVDSDGDGCADKICVFHETELRRTDKVPQNPKCVGCHSLCVDRKPSYCNKGCGCMKPCACKGLVHYPKVPKPCSCHSPSFQPLPPCEIPFNGTLVEMDMVELAAIHAVDRMLGLPPHPGLWFPPSPCEPVRSFGKPCGCVKPCGCGRH